MIMNLDRPLHFKVKRDNVSVHKGWVILKPLRGQTSAHKVSDLGIKILYRLYNVLLMPLTK